MEPSFITALDVIPHVNLNCIWFFRLQERRLAQQREVLRKERETAQKIAARAYTQKYMSGLLTTVFSSLRTDGYFYDPIERGQQCFCGQQRWDSEIPDCVSIWFPEIECNFVPWLMSEVDKNMEKRSAARELLDSKMKPHTYSISQKLVS